MSSPSTTASRGPTVLPKKPFPVGRWIAVAAVVAITVICCLPSVGIDADFAAIIQNFANVDRNVTALLNPDWSYWTEPLEPLLETIEMAIISTVAGSLVALPLCFLASNVTTPFKSAVATFRVLLSLLRAVPDLLFAALFVTMVGVGAISGILALFLFSIGIIVKLTSEVIDAVDTGPLEAARSVGAGWIQSDRVAVLPQILPSFTGTTLYVFELNIRASAVLGLVGAGGLGEVINTQRKFFHYDRISVIVIEILVVVILLEMVSQMLRKRLS